MSEFRRLASASAASPLPQPSPQSLVSSPGLGVQFNYYTVERGLVPSPSNADKHISLQVLLLHEEAGRSTLSGRYCLLLAR
jgi:hypothetical protein